MTAAALTIDAIGKRCPLPVIELARRIDDVPVGEIVRLLADDPAAAADVTAWCRMRSHEYVGTEPVDASTDGATAYLVRRLH